MKNLRLGSPVNQQIKKFGLTGKNKTKQHRAQTIKFINLLNL